MYTDEEKISNLHEKIKKSIEEIVSLKPKVKEEKLRNVKEMITFYTNSTNQIEERRIRIGELSWQSLVILLTAASLLILSNFLLIIKIPIVIIIIFLVVVQVLKIREYFAQSTYDYPFKRNKGFNNNWKWFYYGNDSVTKISENPFNLEKTEISDNYYYLEGLKFFLDSYKNEDNNTELVDGLQQLFLLQVHNYYKNRFYLRLLELERIWYKGVFISIIVISVIVLFLLGFSYFYFFDIFNFLLTH